MADKSKRGSLGGSVSQEMGEIKKELFRKAGFHKNPEGYVEIKEILNQLIGDKGNEVNLLKKFARLGYTELYKKDKKSALHEAEQFLNLLFGNVDELVKLRPDKALMKNLRDRSTLKGKYRILARLGEGGQATVKLGQEIKTGQKVAVKIFKDVDRKMTANFETECKLLAKLQHQNILRLLDSYTSVKYRNKPKHFCVVELCDNGEVIQYLSYVDAFNEKLGRWFFKDLVNAIEYCHKKNIIHRDLKHDNCLFGGGYKLKVTDFGYATEWDRKKPMEEYVGTREYAAPEILENVPYHEKVDVFSMGVMLFVLLTRSRPFNKATKDDKKYVPFLKKDAKKFWKIHDKNKRVAHLSHEVKNLISGMLWVDPAKRYSIEDIKKDPWTQGEAYAQKDAAQYLQRKFAKLQRKSMKESNQAADADKRALQGNLKAKITPSIFSDAVRKWNKLNNGYIERLDQLLLEDGLLSENFQKAVIEATSFEKKLKEISVPRSSDKEKFAKIETEIAQMEKERLQIWESLAEVQSGGKRYIEIVVPDVKEEDLIAKPGKPKPIDPRELEFEFLGRNEETGNYIVSFLGDVKLRKMNGSVTTKKVDAGPVVWTDCTHGAIQWPDAYPPEYPFDRPNVPTYFYSDQQPGDIIDGLVNYLSKDIFTKYGDRIIKPTEYDDDEPNVVSGGGIEDQDDSDDEKDDEPREDDSDIEEDKDTINPFEVRFGVELLADARDKEGDIIEGRIQIYHRRTNPIHNFVIFQRKAFRLDEEPDYLLFPKIFEMILKGCGNLVYEPKDAKEFKDKVADEEKELLSVQSE